jgi:hypothetical protein
MDGFRRARLFNAQYRATVGETDGNGAAFRTPVSATITGVNFGPQMFLFVRWVDAAIAGPEDGLAIDDFSLTPSSTLNVNDPPVNSSRLHRRSNPTRLQPSMAFSIADPDAGSSIVTDDAFRSARVIDIRHGRWRHHSTQRKLPPYTLQGTVDQINATLGPTDNLIYRGSPGFSGVDTLTIKTIDNPPWTSPARRATPIR